MTPEQVQKMQHIYDEAIAKLQALTIEKQDIIKEYIQELEAQKVKALREGFGLQDNSH